MNKKLIQRYNFWMEMLESATFHERQWRDYPDDLFGIRRKYHIRYVYLSVWIGKRIKLVERDMLGGLLNEFFRDPKNWNKENDMGGNNVWIDCDKPEDGTVRVRVLFDDVIECG